MNICTECGEDFVTVAAFDEHRTGVHDYGFKEGLEKNPPVEDGRRCFGVDELKAFGWTRRDNGLWSYPRDWTKQAWKWDVVVPEAAGSEEAA